MERRSAEEEQALAAGNVAAAFSEPLHRNIAALDGFPGTVGHNMLLA
jgi:hypothetical protein